MVLARLYCMIGTGAWAMEAIIWVLGNDYFNHQKFRITVEKKLKTYTKIVEIKFK